MSKWITLKVSWIFISLDLLLNRLIVHHIFPWLMVTLWDWKNDFSVLLYDSVLGHYYSKLQKYRDSPPLLLFERTCSRWRLCSVFNRKTVPVFHSSYDSLKVKVSSPFVSYELWVRPGPVLTETKSSSETVRSSSFVTNESLYRS